MRRTIKKGRKLFKSKRHGKTRRVQRGGAPRTVMENGNQIGEYDDETGFGMANYPEVGEYVGHFLDGVAHGEGTIKYSNGRVYEGNWLDDKRHGRGKLTYPDGGEYEGQWDNNKKNGPGKLTYANGKVYEGQWSHDLQNGIGKMTDADGDVYEGEWLNGKHHGTGFFGFYDGKGEFDETYVGQWENDKRHGQGTSRYPNGRVYEGNWLDDKRHGQGIEKYQDGTMYFGNWDDDQMNGHGTYTFAPTPGASERSVYKGNMLNGRFNGQGILKYADGAVYVGEWLDNQKSGQGEITNADSSTYKGEYLNNAMHGRGTYTFANGDVYVGRLENDYFTGQGTMRYANGDVYQGQWANDKKNGRGTMRYANGDVYEGNWLNNNMHDVNGRYTKHADGKVQVGNWINNDMHGIGLYEGELNEDGLANGRGTCTFINDDVYQGMWEANYIHGQGRMTYHNGDVYEGPWRYDQRHGENGRMRYADDGRVYEGEWWKDKMHGDGTMTAANGDVIYEGLWKNDAQIPVFFDPATGTLTDNGDYVPPTAIAAQFPISFNMLYTNDKIKGKYQFSDLIYNEEKNVVDELTEDPTTIALLLNRTYYVPSTDRLLQLMNDRRLIRYECTKKDTADEFSIDTDVNKTVPYFGLNGIVSNQGGVVPLFDLWAAINSGHRAFELVKTRRKLLTVASHHVAYDYGSWVGSAHCQGDKDADIYEISILRLREKPRSHNKTRRNGSSSSGQRSHPYNPGR